MSETVVIENARLELLRGLAWLDDYGRGRGEHWPTHSPLVGEDADWQNDAEDIILAAMEAQKMGHIEANAVHESTDQTARLMTRLFGKQWMVRITPAGYAWIRAHDAVGEATQERP